MRRLQGSGFRALTAWVRCGGLFTAVLLAPATRADDGGSVIQLPVVVSAEGRGGVFFRTRVAIVNLGQDTNEIRAHVGIGGGLDVVLGTLALDEQKVYEDFLPEAVGAAGAAGVVFTTSQPAALTAEITLDSGDGRRYSTVVPPSDGLPTLLAQSPLGQVEPVPPLPAAISLPVTVDSYTRTNLACTNLTASPWRVRADVHAADGRLVESRDLSIDPDGFAQVALANAVAGGYVEWTTVGAAPDGRRDCYAVVVDNGTNDARIVRARADVATDWFDIPWLASSAAGNERNELAVFNLTPNAYSIGVWLPGEGYPGTLPIRPEELQVLTVDNWPMTLDSGDGLPGFESRLFAAAAYVSAASAHGRRITDLPPMFPFQYQASAVSPGIQADDSTETLLRCSTVWGSPMHVTATVRDGTGAEVETHDFVTPAGVVEEKVEAAVPSGYVVWAMSGGFDDGDYPHYCWAVKRNLASDDETILPAQRVSGF